MAAEAWLSSVNMYVGTYTVSQKRIPHIFDRNLKKYYQILIVFLREHSWHNWHQMTIQIFTSPTVCSPTTGENQNKWKITFLFKVV